MSAQATHLDLAASSDFFEEEGLRLLAVAMVEQSLHSIVKGAPEEPQERQWLASGAGMVFFRQAFPSIVNPAAAIEQILSQKEVAQRLFTFMRSKSSFVSASTSGGLREMGVAADLTFLDSEGDLDACEEPVLMAER